MAVDYCSLDPEMRLCVTLLCSLRHTPSSRVREARAAALARWRAKRQRRRRAAGNPQEKSDVRYGVRKKLADSRPRVRGRFLKKKGRKAQGKSQENTKSEVVPQQDPDTESSHGGKEEGDSLGLEEERSKKANGDVADEGPHCDIEKANFDTVQECNRQDNDGEDRTHPQVTGACVEKNLVAKSKVVAAA